jgi:hypothetical protein
MSPNMRPNTMRRTAFAVITGAALVAPALWATPAKADPGKESLLASLPRADVPNPAKAPARIGGGERVRGVSMRPVPESNDTRTLSSDLDAGPDNEEVHACVQTNEEESPQSDTWGHGMAQYYFSPRQGVAIARVESVDESKSPATLQSIELWVDATTGGTRQIARRSIALGKLQDLPGGNHVYGFRSNNDVHIVITQGATKVPSHQLSRLPGFMAVSSRMRSIGAQCPMAHFSMSAERGDGESLSVRFGTIKELGTVPADDGETPERAKIEQRDAFLHASLSFGESEAAPTLSLASGWAAKERVVEIPIGAPAPAFKRAFRKRR